MGNNKEILKEIHNIDAVNFLAYEKWLEEKELQGWNLKEISYLNEHVFEKGKKRKVRYCLGEEKALNKEYKEMFRDFGWTLVHEVNNNYLWMMEYEGERPEAYNDMEEIEKRNNAYLKRLSITLIAAAIYLMYSISVMDGSVAWLFIGGSFLIAYFFMHLYPHIKYIKAFRKNREILKEYKDAKGI